MAESAGTGARVQPPLLLRVAVPGASLSGAAGLALAGAAGPGAELVFAAGVVAALGGLMYLFSPRAGAFVLMGVGIVTLVFSGFALALSGSVPWLLVTFWGASATLLAGLMHLIERGNSAELMSGVTVGTVVAVLVLSALGLGQYVQMNWTSEERATLERLPFLSEQSGGTAALGFEVVVDSVEPVPGGQWAAYCTYRGQDRTATISEMTRLLTSHGWEIIAEVDGEFTAAKDAYRVTVVAEQTESVKPGPSKYPAAAVSQTSFAAYVWAETP